MWMQTNSCLLKIKDDAGIPSFENEHEKSNILEPTTDLLDKCRSGNHKAFKKLFQMYSLYAQNLIFKITGYGGDHDDLLQETFYKLYLSINSFNGDSLFKTWFHRLVTNVCYSWLRQQNAVKRISSKSAIKLGERIVEIPDSVAGVQQVLESKETIKLAYNTLDKKLRVTLLLNVYYELKIHEIAVVMGVPTGTVKSRLFYAKKKVKQFLLAYYC